MSKIFLVIIIFNIFLFFLIKRPKILNLILDKPDNYRKIHVKNTSSIGGFIFILNLILLFILNETSQNFYNLKPIYNSVELNVFFFISLVLIFTLGVFDDVKNICILNRLFQPGVRDGFLSSIFRLPEQEAWPVGRPPRLWAWVSFGSGPQQRLAFLLCRIRHNDQ